MRCGECGREIDDGSRYCPWCGADMPRTVPRPSHRRPAATAAVVIVAVILVAALVVVFDGQDTSNKNTEPHVMPDGGSETVVFTDGVYYVSGDEKDLFDFDLGTDAEGNIVMTVSLVPSAAAGYSNFIWYVNDQANWPWGYQQIQKTVPELEWTLTDGTVGQYTVGVFCSDSQSFPTYIPWNSKEFSVDVLIDGNITKHYTWSYEGVDYQLDTDYRFSDYLDVAGDSGASLIKRAGYGNGTYSVVSDFITTDPTVTEMEQGLSQLYLQSHETVDPAGFSEFVLAFVQDCFDYTYDSVLYGQEEYYAFPLETIHNGGGDCEDTSILCAAIYAAAGLPSGVFIIPGHAIAAVALEDFVPEPVADARYVPDVSVFSYTVDGKTYYGCETTLDANSYGVGWISSEYSISEDGTVYYEGEPYRNAGYGLYLTPASQY